MRFPSLFVIGLLFCAALPGCKKPPAQSQAPPPGRPSGTPLTVATLEPCALLQPAEIAEVQETKIEPGKPSASNEGAFRMAQCFYTADENSKSVNLAVTQRNPANPKRSPKEFWTETFHRGQSASGDVEEKERDGAAVAKGEEENEKSAPPRQVAGIGDDAYWMGRDALYVLKGDLFFRISVGGPEPVESKLDKARKLAGHVLERLPHAR